MNVLFDVDETLSKLELDKDTPIDETIAILKALAKDDHFIYVSSGGGVDYAERRCRQLGIAGYVAKIVPKDPDIIKLLNIDVSFDDQETRFGKVNLQVRVR